MAMLRQRALGTISFVMFFSVGIPLLWAAAPTRTQTYTNNTTIEASAVTENEDNIFTYLQAGVDTYAASSITAAALAADSVGSSELTADSVGVSELAESLTVADGFLLSLGSVNTSSTSEGLILPQATSCASGTAEGQLCWDTDDDRFVVGDGTQAQLESAYFTGTLTRDTTTASGTQAVTGVGFKPKAVIFIAAENATTEVSVGMDVLSTQVVLAANPTNWIAPSTGFSIMARQNGDTDKYEGKITTLGSDGFTITWTKTGSPSGTLAVGYLAIR